MIGIVLVCHHRIKTTEQSVIAFIMAFVITGFFLSKQHTANVQTITNNNALIMIHHYGKTFLLINNHRLHYRLPSSSWINYTLPSELITATGQKHIDSIIVCSLTPATCSFLKELVSKIIIKTIFIPSQTLQTSFNDLSNAAKQYHVTLVPVDNRSTIMLNAADSITLSSQRYNNKTILHVTGFCGNSAIHAGCNYS